MSCYEALAASYDGLTRDIPYEKYLRFFKTLLRRHGVTATTVLDLACGTGSLSVLLAKHDTVINTIPAPVLPRKMLEKLPRGALVIDLASLPGGTDFDAAEALGIRAEHALALPGKCAPDTAGALIAQTVLTILQERGDLHDEPA